MTVQRSIAGALASVAFALGSAQAAEMTVASWGGSYQDAQRAALFEPFSKASGVTVHEDNYLGGWGQFQAVQDTGVIPFDVVQVEAAELARGCEEGVFVELDWSRIAAQDAFVDLAVQACGVGQTSWATVVTYNTDTIGTAPMQVADFWDTATWPGKRGLRKGPKFNVEFALMADGVAPADVCSVLNSEGGVDRAFNKLSAIKDDIVWWETGAQPGEMVTSGDVVMSMAYSNRIADEREQGKPEGILWDGNLNGMDYWAVLNGSENVDAAYQFLQYYATPEPQIEFARHYALGPSLKAAWDQIPADKMPVMPAGDFLKQGVFTGDPQCIEFWVDNQQELTERWNAWAGQ